MWSFGWILNCHGLNIASRQYSNCHRQKRMHNISILYIEKVFYTIDHPLLLMKLWHYGIRAIAYHWLSSFLAEENSMLKEKIFNLNFCKL